MRRARLLLLPLGTTGYRGRNGTSVRTRNLRQRVTTIETAFAMARGGTPQLQATRSAGGFYLGAPEQLN